VPSKHRFDWLGRTSQLKGTRVKPLNLGIYAFTMPTKYGKGNDFVWVSLLFFPSFQSVIQVGDIDEWTTGRTLPVLFRADFENAYITWSTSKSRRLNHNPSYAVLPCSGSSSPLWPLPSFLHSPRTLASSIAFTAAQIKFPSQVTFPFRRKPPFPRLLCRQD
jgi:hypothetical protein